MKTIFVAILALTVGHIGCDSAKPEADADVQVKYEVTGAAESAIIEFIDGDNQVKRTGEEPLPWSREFTSSPGAQLFLSAAGQGEQTQVRISIGGESVRFAESERDGFARVSMRIQSP